MVPYTGQQDAKHRDAHQGVAHAEQLPVPGPRRQVPKPWWGNSEKSDREFPVVHSNASRAGEERGAIFSYNWAPFHLQPLDRGATEASFKG